MQIDPIDAGIGDRLRRVRESRNISQAALGRALGVSFQQVQKYETGKNRLSSARLLRAAVHLQCAVHDILGPIAGVGAADDPAAIVFATPGGLQLARIWRDLSPERRQILIHLAAALQACAAPQPRSA